MGDNLEPNGLSMVCKVLGIPIDAAESPLLYERFEVVHRADQAAILAPKRRPAVPLTRLDHVNLRTAKLQALQDFYIEVLGMELGARPPFAFGGAWLYSGAPRDEPRPTVHLVEVAAPPAPEGELRLEHFAFAAEGLGDFLATLKRHGVDYRIGVVPGFDIIQVNVHDPDGNHIHIDFAPAEAAQAPDEPALATLLARV